MKIGIQRFDDQAVVFFFGQTADTETSEKPHVLYQDRKTALQDREIRIVGSVLRMHRRDIALDFGVDPTRRMAE